VKSIDIGEGVDESHELSTGWDRSVLMLLRDSLRASFLSLAQRARSRYLADVTVRRSAHDKDIT
jgi:hypothetical protein